MKVSELKLMLENYPDDIEVVVDKWSDYVLLSPVESKVINAVQQGEWVMRSHSSMSDENKSKEKQYLYLAGN